MSARHYDRLLLAGALSVASLNLTLIAAPPVASAAPATVQPIPCRAARAVDGDTIRCAGMPRPIRMAGVDAPELPGHCRRGRLCAPGDPVAARTALQRLLARGRVTVEIHRTDPYQRPVAIIRAHGRNLACALLARGHAQRVTRWDVARSLKECR